MKVSIVIPVYNVYPYLQECVESVQKLKTNMQVILVDDGSTDNSGALCDELAAKDSRITVVHQSNGGLSAARNTGIRHSSGDYVMFLDSDDFFDPEATDQMLAHLRNDPDILMGLYQNYYTATQHCEKEDCQAFLRVEGLMPMEHFLETVPADGRSCYMTAWRFVIRWEFLVENELFFLPGIYHEDEEWTLRLLTRADTILVTHQYFYQYRQARAGAITSAVKPKHIWDTFAILEAANSLLEGLPEGSPKASYVRDRMAQMYLSNMISVRVLSGQDKKTAYRKLDQYKSVCADRMTGTIGNCAKLCQKLFGTRATCAALQLARRLVKTNQ